MEGSATISVIGRCAVPSCTRPATTHLVISGGGHTVAGAVCDRCAEASRLAAFLLEVVAA
jgi:hypothetical protein